MFVPPVVLLPLAGFSEDLLLSLVFRSLPCHASECIYSFVSFVFISLGVLWDSWVCDLVTVTHLGQPSIAVTLNIPPALSTLSTWDSDYVNTSFHRGWIWCSCPSSGTYTLGFCLFASIWVMSTGLSLHPLIPPFSFPWFLPLMILLQGFLLCHLLFVSSLFPCFFQFLFAEITHLIMRVTHFFIIVSNMLITITLVPSLIVLASVP